MVMLLAKRKSDGRIVSVNDVKSGKSCLCVCVSCGSDLVAKVMNRQRIKHFAHEGIAICPNGGTSAEMSSIHMFAQQTLCDRKIIRLPQSYEIIDDGRSASMHLMASTVIEHFSVVLEPQKDGYRPDAFINHNGNEYAVEFVYTNNVSDSKRHLYAQNKVSCIVIDLNNGLHIDDVSRLSDHILIGDAPREWVYDALYDIAKTDVDKRNQAYAKHKEKLTLLKSAKPNVYLAMTDTVKRKASFTENEYHSSIKRFVCAYGMEGITNIEVIGDIYMQVPNHIWQGIILHHLYRKDSADYDGGYLFTHIMNKLRSERVFHIQLEYEKIPYVDKGLIADVDGIVSVVKKYLEYVVTQGFVQKTKTPLLGERYYLLKSI